MGPQVSSLVAWPGAAAQKGTHAGQHFFHLERFDHIIIGTGVKARHLVAPAVTRRENQHRHLLAGAAPFFQDADAVQNRQAEVQDHRIIGFGFAEEVPLLAIHGLVDHIACIAEGGHNLPVQVGIVFNDKYAHSFPSQCGRQPGDYRIEPWVPSTLTRITLPSTARVTI